MERDFISRQKWATFGRDESSEEFITKWAEQKERAPFLLNKPRFSIILTASNKTDLKAIQQSVNSVLAQSYSNWELWVFLPENLKHVQQTHSQIHWEVIRSDSTEELKNLGISRAKGDWLGFLEAGDYLNPAALFLLALEIGKQDKTEVFYSNEVLLQEKNEKKYFSKRDHSEFTLRHFDYINSAWWIKKSALADDCLFDKNLAPHSNLNTILRLCEKHVTFSFLSYYLYHSNRGAKRSFSSEIKSTIVSQHLSRIGKSSIVETLSDGRTKVFPSQERLGKISAIICFKDKPEMTLASARSIELGREGCELEILLVNNNSSEESVRKIESALSTFSVPIKLIHFPYAFNFGRMHNIIIDEYSTGELLLLINNDVILSKGSSLAFWGTWAQEKNIGTVGALLRYPNGRIQHAGIRAAYGGPARLARIGNNQDEDPISCHTKEVYANTFAACMLKKETFYQAGKFRQFDLANGFGDAAFGFECLKLGLSNIFLSTIEGTHLEGSTRGRSYEYWEECVLEKEYPGILQKMLREDLALGRVPGADYDLKHFLLEYFKVHFRRSTHFIRVVKSLTQKILQKPVTTWNTIALYFKKT